jgi:hypothetical protein
LKISRVTPQHAERDWRYSTGTTPASELRQILPCIDYAYWGRRWGWSATEAESFIVSILTERESDPILKRKTRR